MGRLSGALHRGQQQGDQHADDRDDHQQLDQCETADAGTHRAGLHPKVTENQFSLSRLIENQFSAFSEVFSRQRARALAWPVPRAVPILVPLRHRTDSSVTA